jgi:hypothetical protein
LRQKQVKEEAIASASDNAPSPEESSTASPGFSQESDQENEKKQSHATRRMCDLVLGKFMRMRQCADHWIIAEAALKDVLTQDDIQCLKKRAGEFDGWTRSQLNRQYIQKMRKALLHAEQTNQIGNPDLNQLEKNVLKSMEDFVPDSTISPGRVHGLKYQYADFMNDLSPDIEEEKKPCCVFCMEEGPQDVLVDCKVKTHLCHNICFQKQLEDGAPKCPVCNAEQQNFPEPLDGTAEQHFTLRRRIGKADAPTSWLSHVRVDPSSKPHDLIASGKTIAVKAQIVRRVSYRSLWSANLTSR